MNIQFHPDQLIGDVILPSSKSLTNRALIIQFLSEQHTEISNSAEANDSLLMNRLLTTLTLKKETHVLNCEDAGTVFRFLTAVCACMPHRDFILTGTDRMLERPIADLVDALHQLKASISYQNKEGFPALKIQGRMLDGGSIKISGRTSSQFISALCLIAPLMPNGLDLLIEGEMVSKEYINMTLKLMQLFGVESQFCENKICIPAAKYIGKKYEIENDWSSATFFFAMALLKPSRIVLNGIYQDSLQGDSLIASMAERLGVRTEYAKTAILIHSESIEGESKDLEFNVRDHPDLAIPFIVCCALKFNRVKLTGLHHLEYKESKRLSALTEELAKVGLVLTYQNDLLRFSKTAQFELTKKIKLETYGDHRLAMAFSLLCLCGIEVELGDTDCVRKSFPHFWTEIEKLGFTISG